MTLTQSSSDANNGARQRFELELLLQRAVPNPDQLSRSKDLLHGAIPEISPEDWKRLQSVPIHSDPDHLDIAIPSDWRDKDWQRLIDQLPIQNRTIRLHPALNEDLQAVLNNTTAIENVTPEELWPSRDGAESASSTETIDSFLDGFNADSVFEAEPDDSDAILESRTLVQEGVLLSTSLIRQKVLPDMALSMLAIGEETGEMDKMLSKVADFYEDEVGAMVKALTSMLEPAMIVVVGGIVGSILLAMYLPMFTVFDQIQ